MAFNRFDQIREVNWDLPLFQPNWQLAAAKLENQQQMYDAPRTAIEQLRAMTDALPEHQERIREYINSYDKRYEDVKQAYLSGNLDEGNKIGKDLAYEVAREMTDPMSALNVARSLKQSQAAKVEQYQKFHEKGSSPDNLAYDAQQLTYSKNFEDYYDFKGRRKLKDIGSFQGTEFYDVRKELTARIKEIGYDEWEEDVERGGIRIKKGGKYVEDDKAQAFLNEFLYDPRVQKQVQVQTWYELSQQGIQDEASFEAIKPQMVEQFNTGVNRIENEFKAYSDKKDKLINDEIPLKEKQQILKDLKLYDGEIDGKDGVKTQTALKAFERLYDQAEDMLESLKKQDPSMMTYQDFTSNKYKENLQGIFNYGKSHLDKKETNLYSDKTLFQQQMANARSRAQMEAQRAMIKEFTANEDNYSFGESGDKTKIVRFGEKAKSLETTVTDLRNNLVSAVQGIAGVKIQNPEVIATVLEMHEKGDNPAKIATYLKGSIPKEQLKFYKMAGEDAINIALMQTVDGIIQGRDTYWNSYTALVEGENNVRDLRGNEEALIKEFETKYPNYDYARDIKKLNERRELEISNAKRLLKGEALSQEIQKIESKYNPANLKARLSQEAYEKGELSGKGLNVPTTINMGDNAKVQTMEEISKTTDFAGWSLVDASGQRTLLTNKQAKALEGKRGDLKARMYRDVDDNGNPMYTINLDGKKYAVSQYETDLIEQSSSKVKAQALNDNNYAAITMLGKERQNNLYVRPLDVDVITQSGKERKTVKTLNGDVFKNQYVVPMTGTQKFSFESGTVSAKMYKNQNGQFFWGVEKNGELTAIPVKMEGDKYIIGQKGIDSKNFSEDADLLMQVYWQNYGLSDAIPVDFNYKRVTARDEEMKSQFPLLMNFNQEEVFNAEE